MTKWLSRLTLTGLLFPVGFVILLFSRIYSARSLGFSMHSSMQLAGFVTFVTTITCYILIWRGMVNWTRWRQRATVAAVALSHPIGIPLGILISQGDDDFGWFLSAVLPIAVVVLASVPIWIQSPFKRKPLPPMSVPCPQCGYDLRGLSEARCPECGTRFTLEQLVRSQA